MPVRMVELKTLTTPNTCKDVEPQKLSFVADQNTKWHNPFERVWQFFTELNLLLLYNSGITLLGICPNVLKTHVHVKPVHRCLYQLFS